ncbi:MAG: type IV secretory system conjugative DNA transfer family protein, partial [Clostridia bacterium]
IMKIVTNTQNDCEDLIQYFSGRSPISKCVSLSKQVLDASDKTRGSYLSTIFDKLAMFSDKSICALTSSNEIDFSKMATKPTALFLQIPDEKETRHTLASMIILQAYKGLVAKANTYSDLALPRSVYFLLDEFGNLPRVHKLEQMITVGRSRKIWLALVIQSYAQLSKIYDEKCADIIRSNCNIQIFIGTTDLKTINDFSKLCGNFSIVQRNVSFSSSKTNDINSSASIKERPLIYPSELSQLNNANNMGNAIVNVFGFSPIKSKFTPSFKCKKYCLKSVKQNAVIGRIFEEEKVFYDMNERNDVIFKKKVKKEQQNDELFKNYFSQLELAITRVKIEYLSDDEKKDLLNKINNRNYDDVIYFLTKILNEEDMEDKIFVIKGILEKVKKIVNLEKPNENKNKT